MIKFYHQKNVFTFLIVLIIFINNNCFSVSKLWDGSSSSAWNTAANWTPSGVPSAADDIIINSTYTNSPILNANLSYKSLTLSGASSVLNLNGFVLTCTTSINLTGGTVTNGTLSTIYFGDITGTSFGTATQNVTLNLTSAATVASICAGGNSFIGNIIINNQSTKNLTFANITGDIFSKTATFNNTSTGKTLIAYNGSNTFSVGVTVNSNNIGGVSFGEGTGSSTLTTGAITTTGFTNGALLINRVTQITNTANGSFSAKNFTCFQCVFQGNITVAAYTINNIQNSTFFGTTNISKNNNTPTNTSDVCQGGNIFNGPTTITNNSQSTLKLSNTSGDTYNAANPIFSSNNSGTFLISFNGATVFANGLIVNTGVGFACVVSFGDGSGTTNLLAGAVTSPPASGCTMGITTTMRFKNFTQQQNVPNTAFSLYRFSAESSSFQGDFSVNSIFSTIVSSNFHRTNVFTNNSATSSINVDGGSNFSSVASTSTTFNYSGTTGLPWGGSNTFGITNFNLSGGLGGFILLSSINYNSSNLGDVFNGLVTINTVPNNGILFASNIGTSYFNENVIVNNTGTQPSSSMIGLGISFGDYYSHSTSNVVMASGKKIISTGIAQAYTFYNFQQLGNVANDPFNCMHFYSANSTFGGNVTANATDVNSTCFLLNSTFSGANSFISPSFLDGSDGLCAQGLGGNTFGGTTYIKRLYGSTLVDINGDPQLDNLCIGGNTYNGDVTFETDETSYLFRLANVSSDDYNSRATFRTTAFGGLLQPAYNGENTFANHISTFGSLDALTFGLGTGRVVIDGNTSQTLSGDVLTSPTFTRLRMNTSGSLSLLVKATITNTATFDVGIINTDNTNLLIFDDGATCSNMNNASYTDGPVRKIGNDAFTFPIGDNNFYAPASITAPSSIADHFTGTYFDSDADVAGYNKTSLASTLDHISNCEYWTINRTAGTSNVRVTLSWDAARSCSVSSLSDLSVARWNSTQWADEGNNATTGSATNGTIQSMVVSSFSPFTIAYKKITSPLAIELINFNAILNDNRNQVDLIWETASETNNDKFELEKSLDGINWYVIGSVKSLGNGENHHAYASIDNELTTNIIYYRLKQIDFDLSFSYSDVKYVDIDNGVNISVFPNPAHDVLTISGNRFGSLNIKLFDSTGKEVYGEVSNEYKMTIFLSHLNSGFYLLKLESKEFGSLIKRIVIQ